MGWRYKVSPCCLVARDYKTSTLSQQPILPHTHNTFLGLLSGDNECNGFIPADFMTRKQFTTINFKAAFVKISHCKMNSGAKGGRLRLRLTATIQNPCYGTTINPVQITNEYGYTTAKIGQQIA